MPSTRTAVLTRSVTSPVCPQPMPIACSGHAPAHAARQQQAVVACTTGSAKPSVNFPPCTSPSQPDSSRHQLVQDRRHRGFMPIAVRTGGSGCAWPASVPARHGPAGREREDRCEHRDGRQHDQRGHDTAEAFVRRHIAVANSSSRGDRPVVWLGPIRRNRSVITDSSCLSLTPPVGPRVANAS